MNDVFGVDTVGRDNAADLFHHLTLGEWFNPHCLQTVPCRCSVYQNQLSCLHHIVLQFRSCHRLQENHGMPVGCLDNINAIISVLRMPAWLFLML